MNSQRFCLCLLSVMLTACASVPMGTMWKMKRLGPEGIIQTSPEGVRAAVLSEAEFLDRASFKNGELSFTLIRPDNTEHSYNFELVDTTDRELRRLDPAPPDQRWRVYAVNPAQYPQYNAMQRAMNAWYQEDELKGSTLRLNVDFGLADTDQDESKQPWSERGVASQEERTIPFRVDLQLDPAEGYFTLINDRDMIVAAASSGSGD